MAIYRIFLSSAKYVNLHKKIKYIYSCLKWLLREDEQFAYYELMKINEYNINQVLGRKELNKLIVKVEDYIKNEKQLNSCEYSTLIKDKFYSTAILQSYHIPCVKNIAFINEGIIHSENKEFSVQEFVNNPKESLIFKNTILEYNEGFFKFEFTNKEIKINSGKLSIPKFENILKQGNWVIQKVESNSNQIKKISSNALNTTRIVTILSNEGPKYLTGFQAFATGSSITDSWGKGSIYIGFNSVNGQLNEFGYNHPSINQSKVYLHPDSKFNFKDVIISEIPKAIDLCIKAHTLFYNSFIIGWDVVITPEGPKILEGNDNPGINAVQCVDKLLRKEIIYFVNRLRK